MYDLSLTEINTQGLDSDLNGNFDAIKDTVNAKAEKNGDAAQRFKVADAVEQKDAVNKGQLDSAVSGLEAEIATKADTTYVDAQLATKADLNGNSNQVFIVANATASNHAVNKGQLDSAVSTIETEISNLETEIDSELAHKTDTVAANTTIYVATTGSDTTGDGTSSAPFATLTKALSFLNGKTLLGAVTIQIADGTYSHTSQIEPNHPQGNLITIQGNASDKALVTLSFTECTGFYIAPNISLNLKYLTISGNRTTNNRGFFSDGSLNLKNCKIMNFDTGIIQEAGYTNLHDVEVTNNVNNGIEARPQGFIYGENVTSTYNGSCGIYAEQTGAVVIGTGTVTNNNYGLYSTWKGYIGAYGMNITSNTSGAMYATGLSLIVTNPATTYSGTVSPAINTQGNMGAYILH